MIPLPRCTLLVALASLLPATARASPLASIPLPQLLSETGPSLAGQGELTSCAGVAVPAETFDGAVAAAERAIQFVDPTSALAALQRAEDMLPCLSQPPSSNLLARAAFLRGLADPEGATAAFTEAFSRRPALAWDDNFPPAGRAAFEAGRAMASSSSPATMRVVPEPIAGTFWVDGHQVQTDHGTVQLAPGRRLIQFAGREWESVVLTIAPGEHTLLLHADEIAGHEAEVMVDAQSRTALAHALSATLPPGTPLSLSGTAGTWSLVSGEEWRHTMPTRPAGRVVVIAGSGLLVAAAAVAGVSLAGYESAQRAMVDAPTYGEAVAQQQAGNMARSGVAAGAWAGAAGAALLGTGLLLQVRWGHAE